jgi:hypothetical protein
MHVFHIINVLICFILQQYYQSRLQEVIMRHNASSAFNLMYIQYLFSVTQGQGPASMLPFEVLSVS